MKRTLFKGLYEKVATAGKSDPVWWAGYLWIDMTEKQTAAIYEALSVNPSVEIAIDLGTGTTSYRLPSGIEMRRTD